MFQIGSESEGSLGEAGTVSCPKKPSSDMNWINGMNKAESGKNLEKLELFVNYAILCKGFHW